MDRLSDFVILGQEDWDEVWRRNQFLIAGLAYRFPASQFLFVELPFDLSYGLRTGKLFDSRSQVRRKLTKLRQGVHQVEGFSNIYTLTVPKFLPDWLRLGETLNAVTAAVVIRKAMRQLRIGRPLLWTQNPSAATLLGRLKERLVVYDLTDDWAALPHASERFRQRVHRGDRMISHYADLIIACSKYLSQQKENQRHKVRLIPNGVNVRHYANAKIVKSPAAGKMQAISHPIIGYSGSLHESRLDIDLICGIAEAKPHLNLVFIGPILLSPQVESRLRRFANIHLLGSVPYQDLPGFIHQCDILIIPHTVSAFTESLNPIKLFEYLASGLPIISTPVAGVRDYAQTICLASTVEQFIKRIDEFLTGLIRWDAERAREQANAADWELRLDQLVNALEVIGAVKPGNGESPST